MLTAETFLAEIDAFLAESGMSATAFGKAAVGDPNFVKDLRDGRSASLRLVEKVNAYISEQHGEAKPQVQAEASP